MIPKCNYHRDTVDDLLKDQFIFGIIVMEIQNSFLSKTASDDSKGKCLLEARNVESQIKQRKLLGIQTNVMQSELMTEIKDRDPNPRTEAVLKAMDMGVVNHKVEMVVIASFVEANIHLENALLMASSATNIMVKIILAEILSKIAE